MWLLLNYENYYCMHFLIDWSQFVIFCSTYLFFSWSSWIRALPRIFVHAFTRSTNMDVHEILDSCFFRCGSMWTSVKTSTTSTKILRSGKHRRRRSKVSSEHCLRTVRVTLLIFNLCFMTSDYFTHPFHPTGLLLATCTLSVCHELYAWSFSENNASLRI